MVLPLNAGVLSDLSSISIPYGPWSGKLPGAFVEYWPLINLCTKALHTLACTHMQAHMCTYAHTLTHPHNHIHRIIHPATHTDYIEILVHAWGRLSGCTPLAVTRGEAQLATTMRTWW